MHAIRAASWKSNFSRLSETVHYIMRLKGFTIIDYIDNYVGVSIPCVTHESYVALLALMAKLGLTVSEKKLVVPSMQAVCLGVLIDSQNGTISILPEKLKQVNVMVHQWLTIVTKQKLKSLLGSLLYVHKCVKPAHIFLNCMLDLLRASHVTQKITLTPEFNRDLRWFATFLPHYNGVSLYDHRSLDVKFELDACLIGLGGRFGNDIYHLPIERGYMNWTIVHLENINVLLALHLFHNQWFTK